MTKQAYSVIGILSAAGGWVANIFGGWDTGLQTLFIVMATDYVTGILCALVWKKSPKTKDGRFESKASFKGLMRKMAILLCIILAVRLDLQVGTTIVRNTVILFFIANDAFSIIENFGIMGVPVPPIIQNAFTVLKQKQIEKQEEKQ